MKSLFIYFVIIFMAFNAYADDDPLDGNYFILEQAYDFDFPNFDVSMNLPANSGFRVPFWHENNSYLDIHTKEEQNVSHYFDTKVIASGEFFFSFSLPGNNREDISLSFLHRHANEKELIDSITKSKNFLTILPPLETGLGTSEGFLLKHNETQLSRKYFFYKDSLLITVNIFASEHDEIEHCEKIAQSLHIADLKEKRDKYIEKVESGHFERKGMQPNPYEYRSGTLPVRTAFDFPKLGIQMSFPEDWVYGVVIEKEKFKENSNPIIVDYSISDLEEQQMVLFNMRKNDVGAFVRIFANTQEAYEYMNRLELDTEQRLLKKFPIEVNGIATEAIVMGSEKLPTINFRLVLKSSTLHFSLMAITSDKLSLAQSIISDIHISEEEKKDLPVSTSEIKPIAEQMEFEEVACEELPDTTITPSETDNEYDLLPVIFQNSGISFEMPEGQTMFVMPEEDRVDNEKAIILKGNPNPNRGGQNITSMLNYDKNEGISVMLNHSMTNLDFETYFKMMAENMKANNTIKVKNAVFFAHKDQKWGIMEYAQMGYNNYMAMTFHEGKTLTIMYIGENKEYRCLINNMLHTFKFTNR